MSEVPRQILDRRPTSNGSNEVGSRDILHIANSSGSLDVDHVRLVSQQPLEELVHLSLDTDCQLGHSDECRFTHFGSSSMTFLAYLTNMQIAIGFLTTDDFPLAPGPNC